MLPLSAQKYKQEKRSQMATFFRSIAALNLPTYAFRRPRADFAPASRQAPFARTQAVRNI